MAMHPADMEPKPLSKEEQAAITAAGHLCIAERGEGVTILLGDPTTYGKNYTNKWTRPAYYVYGYRIRYKVLGGTKIVLQERKYNTSTGEVISDKFRLMHDDSSKIVDRPPGTYVSVFNPYPTTQSIEGDKDFGGGGGDP
ncbi:MAG: hypothetical protein WCP77_19790 [Roseococcus sp.]